MQVLLKAHMKGVNVGVITCYSPVLPNNFVTGTQDKLNYIFIFKVVDLLLVTFADDSLNFFLYFPRMLLSISKKRMSTPV